MITAKIGRRQAEAEPYLVWNAFVELMAEHDYEDLSAEQRPAYLVFWYEAEVQNGGHLQYFENRGVDHRDETIAIVGQLGASCQQQVLRDAAKVLRGRPRRRIETVEDFCSAARAGEFAEFDQRLYACMPHLLISWKNISTVITPRLSRFYDQDRM